MATALQRLDGRHTLVVHGDDGVDELSISSPSLICEVRGEGVREYTISPEDAGLPRAVAHAIRGGTSQENAAVLLNVLNGERGPIRDVVVLNAAAALQAADIAPGLKEGARIAEDAVDSGAAKRRLEEWVQLTQSFA